MDLGSIPAPVLSGTIWRENNNNNVFRRLLPSNPAMFCNLAQGKACPKRHRHLPEFDSIAQPVGQISPKLSELNPSITSKPINEVRIFIFLLITEHSSLLTITIIMVTLRGSFCTFRSERFSQMQTNLAFEIR